jgi:hypothetical protein
MYSSSINEVVRAFLHDDSRVRRYKSPEGVIDVVRAVDVGVCRLVPLTDHAVRLTDTSWNIELGVELTEQGERAAARIARG